MRTSKQFPLVLELQARKYGGYLVVFALIMVIVALGVAVGFSYLMSPGERVVDSSWPRVLRPSS